ncbi:hypothetical protein [Enterococcus sp. AZ192]|uniref:hypothetical protein n=2 Tax=Enterococcus TaxID=1350 RepID=UPI003D26F3EF
MVNKYLKQETVTPSAEITLGAHKQQKLESVIYSYDKDISKLIIPVTVPKCKELDFENVETVKILLTVVQDRKEKKIEDTATIEKIHRRHISYIITDRLNGYQGNVKMNVYLDLKNGQQIDLAEYGFTMVRSAIDQNMPEIEDFYFKSLDDVITELKQKTEAAWQEVAGDLSEINGSIDAANEKINQLENKADEISDQIANNDFRNFIMGKEIIIDEKATMIGKVSGSLVENPHRMFSNMGKAILNPNQFNYEIGSTSYADSAELDNKIYTTQTSVAEQMRQVGVHFNIVEDIERKYQGIFETFGAITQQQKVAVAKSVISLISYGVYAMASSSTSNELSTAPRAKDAWGGVMITKGDKIHLNSRKFTGGQIDVVIQDDGFMYVVIFAPPSDGTAPSMINIDQVYLEYQIKFKMSDVYVSKNNQFTPILIVAPNAGADDLDKYTKAGYYLCRTSAYATNVLNTPINIAFRLEVQELVSSGELPGVNQLLTTYHTNNTSFRRFTRNLYNGVWSVWREIPFVDQVQISKVTQDNGDALIKVSDTETILDRVLASGAGYKTGEATGKTADAPSTSNTRLKITMVNATAGVVDATDTGGVNYTRVISGSAWRDEWKRQPTAKEFSDLAAKVAALESKVK